MKIDKGRSENFATEPTARLLIIQPMVGIGDMVWHKPWLDAAIASHSFEVILMAKPSSQAKTVLAEHRGLEIVPLFRSERGKKGRHDGIFGFFRMALALQSVQADEVWILHRSWRYAAAAWLAGIPARSGYGLGKQRWFLNRNIGLDALYRRAHPRYAASAFFAEKGITPKDTHPKIIPDAAASSRAAELLKKAGPLIIFGVGAADAPRRWSPHHFASLIDRLNTRCPEMTFALCGSPVESDIGDEICKALKPSTPKPMMVFDQSVATVIALHATARLYIGNDTSLINIAAAVGTPAVRIFASSLPVLDSPLISTVLPADKTRLDIPGSIDDIQPDDVMTKALLQLEEGGRNRPPRLSKSKKRRKTGE
jgi:heptosyltransferase-2